MAHDGSASHYGSTVGEVAVCLHAVGLADRHELRSLELRGPARAIDRAVAQVTGRQPPAGVAVRGAGAWWCRMSEQQALLVCGPGAERDLSARLEKLCAKGHGLSWLAVASQHEALALVGPCSADVLAVTCPSATQRLCSIGRFASLPIGGEPCLVLREAETQYLVLVPRGTAVSAWRALELAGIGFHMATVGRQALDRFTVGRRTQAHQVRA